MLRTREAPADRQRAGELLAAAAELASKLRLDGLGHRIAALSESVAERAQL